MQPAHLQSLFGTTEPPVPNRSVTVGDMQLQVTPGRIHHIIYRGTEILRAVELVVRDDEWGTLKLHPCDESESKTEDGWHYQYHAMARSQRCGTLDCRMDLHVTGNSIRLSAQLTGNPSFTTCRAGLVVLYPLKNVAGKAACVLHNSGITQDSIFPSDISPDQPFFDIAAIRHQPTPTLDVNCRFSGDVFEMEDQRNWTDASFKVYNRPLAWPNPYLIDQGTGAKQTVELTIRDKPDTAPTLGNTTTNNTRIRVTGYHVTRLPQLGSGLDIQQTDSSTDCVDLLRLLTPRHIQLLIDLRTENYQRRLQISLEALRKAEISVPLWAGVITPDAPDQYAPLASLAHELSAQSVTPTGILALPAAYLKSYQPDADWPTGASPDNAIEAARVAFPDIPIGGGMLTYFTEVNRCRPDPDTIDFISHATTAIVHAADDSSVMESLQGLSHVFCSCQKLAPHKAYRLGMSAIGMWANPYGDKPLANPARQRLPMAATDPRQHGLFGAAWNLGYYAAACSAGVNEITLASATGPFSVGQPSLLHPVFHVLRGMAKGSGKPMLAFTTNTGDKVAVVGWRDDSLATCEVWLANLTPATIHVELEGLCIDGKSQLGTESRTSGDHEWMDRLQSATSTGFEIPGYDVLRVIGRGDFD